MNPDACRDVMDRSRLPYDTPKDLNKVTNGLDELSLKKQLPLRQQATKPVLKYNMSMTKSVHLFSHGDGVPDRRDSTGVNLYTQNGMYYTGHVNGGHQSYLQEHTPASRYSTVQQMVTTQHPGNGRILTSANPYIRPVSATEVAANINSDKARKMVETAAAMSNISDVTTPAYQTQAPQRNSFLRPLSGQSVTKERPSATSRPAVSHSATSQHNPSDGASLQRQNSTVSDTYAKAIAESKFAKKTLFDFASTTSSTHVKPNIIHQNIVQKDIIQHPGSVSQVSKTSSFSPESPAVRNPSYSPNRPYVDNNPPDQSNRDIVTSFQTSNMSTKPDVRQNYDRGEPIPGSAISTVPPKGSESTLKKMPVTNTLTGTVYYRKTSISDSLSKSDINLSSVTVRSDIPEPKIVSSRSSNSLKSFNHDALHKRGNLDQGNTKRPSFERSNASLQFNGNTPVAAPDRKNEIKQSSSEAPNTPVYNKPPTGCKDRQSNKGEAKETKLQQQIKKQSVGPSRSSSDKSLNSSRKSGHHKRGSLSSTSHLEQRPLGDGAPARPHKNTERGPGTGRLASDEESAEDDYSEDDEQDDSGSNASPSGERLPGDGEASVEDYGGDDDDDDEDALDNFEDTTSDADEGGSDGYSITSASSSVVGRPATAQSGRRAGVNGERGALLERTSIRPVTASGDVQIKPAFRFSLFNKIPPTLNFVSEGEKAEQLPWELRKLLKWKMSPITPIVVKVALARVGFRVTKRNHDWLGCFGKHMKAQCFKSMREYQKLNHFPGSFQIGRKDRLWRNLSRLQLQFGKAEFSFFPQTYVLPCDLKQLKRAWDEGNTKQKWIIKPPASARGIGIRVISKWAQIPRRKPVIVQRYLHRPYLINDSKFDMRIYVYVTSYDPLRIYVYDDGLARFASCKYSSSMKSLSNKFMHLTNYSVNKKNSEYTSNSDNGTAMGHKWSLKTLWNFMKRQGHNTNMIWDSIRDLIIKTIISGDSAINSMTKSNARSRYCCHELFGFDVLLDESMKPWILEVNISPSLHSNSPLDIQIKGGLIKDMMNLAGMRIPDERDVSNNPPSGDFSAHRPTNKYCMDKRLFTNQLAPDERAKHAYFCQKHQDELKFQATLRKQRRVLGFDPCPVSEHIQIMQSILDTLTPDDLRFLCESIDEDSRKGNFQRLFPTPHTHRYLRFFQAPRYYNLLLDQWVLRYNRMEQRGILLLQSFCDEGIHLENPTPNPRHQWMPPNSSITTFRSPDVRVLGSLNSARGSGPTAPPHAQVKKHGLQKLKAVASSSSIAQSNSSNSLTSLVGSSPQLHSPSPIGPISSPSR